MIAIFISVSTLLVYLLTLSPTVGGFDSGDVITAAVVKGVAHPPGYPLYVMIGHLFTLLPIPQDPAWKMNFFSALTHAITLAIMYFVFKKITKNAIVSAISSLILAFSYTFWQYSNFAEVFPLNNLIISLFLLVFLIWDEQNPNNAKKWLVLLSFITGLSLTHHHTIVLIFPLTFIYIYQKTKHILKDWKYLAKLAVAFLLGLLPYLYVPIAASKNPPINWENATGLSDFIKLITRAAYGTFQAQSVTGPSGFERLHQITLYFQFLKDDFLVVGLLLAILGLIWLIFENKKLAFLFLGNFFLSGPFFLFYANFPRDEPFTFGVIERFLLTSYLFFSIFIACGISAAVKIISFYLKRIKTLSTQTEIIIIVIYFLFSLFPGYLLLRNWDGVDLSASFTGKNYARDIFLTVEPNSIVMIADDTGFFNFQYLMYAENSIKNVALFTTTTLQKPDQKAALQKKLPDVFIPEENNQFKKTIKFLSVNSSKYPIYSFNFSPKIEGKEWRSEGLMMRLYDKNEKLTPQKIKKNEKLWNSYFNSTDSLVATKGNLLLEHFRTVYNIGHNAAGKIYIDEEQYDLAIHHLTQSLALKPNDTIAALALGTAFAKKGDCKTAIAIFENITKYQPNMAEAYQNLTSAQKQCDDNLNSEKTEKIWKEKLRLKEFPLNRL